MSPLEAVARALATRNGTLWDFDPSDSNDVYMDQARAALTALRDAGVTEGMITVGYNYGSPADVFRAMLDAALAE